MLIRKVSLQDLNAAPYNPRIPLKPGDARWKKLERSLAEFSLVQPIVWNERTGHVVSGHQRLAVLRHRGETEVDCVIVDLPLNQEKALNVTLNNASVGSDWDADKLVDLVEELQNLPDFDATLTGFDAQQLQDLVLTPVAFDPSAPASGAGESDRVQVALEVAADDWDDVQTHLDDLLAEFPDTRLHLRRGG